MSQANTYPPSQAPLGVSLTCSPPQTSGGVPGRCVHLTLLSQCDPHQALLGAGCTAGEVALWRDPRGSLHYMYQFSGRVGCYQRIADSSLCYLIARRYLPGGWHSELISTMTQSYEVYETLESQVESCFRPLHGFSAILTSPLSLGCV